MFKGVEQKMNEFKSEFEKISWELRMGFINQEEFDRRWEIEAKKIKK